MPVTRRSGRSALGKSARGNGSRQETGKFEAAKATAQDDVLRRLGNYKSNQMKRKEQRQREKQQKKEEQERQARLRRGERTRRRRSSVAPKPAEASPDEGLATQERVSPAKKTRLQVTSEPAACSPEQQQEKAQPVVPSTPTAANRPPRPAEAPTAGAQAIPSTPELNKTEPSELIRILRCCKRELLELKRSAGNTNIAAELRQANTECATKAAELVSAQQQLSAARQRLEEAERTSSEALRQAIAQSQRHLDEAEAAAKREKAAEEAAAALQARCQGLAAELGAAQARAEELAAALQRETAALTDAREEAATMAARFERSDELRLRLEEEVLDLKGAIRVLVRVRPAVSEQEGGAEQTFRFGEGEAEAGEAAAGGGREGGEASGVTMEEVTLVQGKGKGVGGYGEGVAKRNRFKFHRVLPPTSTQSEVYEEVRGVVASCLQGRRACIFAYGQTGAGKTHTMDGPSHAIQAALRAGVGAEGSSERLPAACGLTPRAIAQVMERKAVLEQHGWAVTVTLAAVEVYNEQVRDLIAGFSAGDGEEEAEEAAGGEVAVRLDRATGLPQVTGRREVAAGSFADVLPILHHAARNRSTGSTKMNARSSRSHCVVTVQVRCAHAASGQQRAGSLNLVDLAGSERIARSGAGDNPKRLAEATNINKSLSTLGTVLRALATNATGHVPFRNSKLTHLLQPSLTRGARALMVCNLSPDAASEAESLCSLRFAEDVASATTRGGGARTTGRKRK